MISLTAAFLDRDYNAAMNILFAMTEKLVMSHRVQNRFIVYQ